MAIAFKVRDILHKLIVKFFPAYLPNAKKKFYARVVLQQRLDIHGIASRAEAYNITTPPEIIEEGMIAGCQLIYYLIGDGFKIDTPIVHLNVGVPGEWDGYETHLPSGVYPTVLARVNNDLREYVKNNVQLVFDGVADNNGAINLLINEATKEEDSTVTINNFITIHGIGLKIKSDDKHAEQVGLFFVDESGNEYPVTRIAVNEPKTLRAIVPQSVSVGTSYYVRVRTQSVAKSSGILKSVREMTSDFSVIVIK